jgi:hypothetical protein
MPLSWPTVVDTGRFVKTMGVDGNDGETMWTFIDVLGSALASEPGTEEVEVSNEDATSDESVDGSAGAGSAVAVASLMVSLSSAIVVALCASTRQ